MSKPGRKIFDRALEIANSSFQDSIMIGDSLSSDITGAKNLGITSCLISDTLELNVHNPKPDMISNSFTKFVDYVCEF